MPRPQSGPPLIVPAVAFAALTIAAVAVAAGVPRPDDPAAEVVSYIGAHATAMRWSAFLFLGSSVPLAIWSATAYRRLRALGITAPGGAIALVGGTLAAGFTALSGLVTWASSRAPGDEAVVGVLRDLAFVAGGPAFGGFFGLLLAGVSVPMLLMGVQRWLAVAGLVLAAAGELSTLTLLSVDLAALIALARFGGILWLLATSLLLPASRPRSTPVPKNPALWEGQQ
jgi:hypothetical protein